MLLSGPPGVASTRLPLFNKQLAGPMVCRVNGLAYCLSRISTWQGASPYGVPLGRPVGLLTAAGNSSGFGDYYY